MIQSTWGRGGNNTSRTSSTSYQIQGEIRATNSGPCRVADICDLKYRLKLYLLQKLNPKLFQLPPEPNATITCNRNFRIHRRYFQTHNFIKLISKERCGHQFLAASIRTHFFKLPYLQISALLNLCLVNCPDT